MKLIDLLVQELPRRGCWPEGVRFLAQDSRGILEGHHKLPTFIAAENDWSICTYIAGSRDFKRLEVADDHKSTAISREQYESALAASKQVEWDGEGLPPVGCECEFFNDDRFDCRPSVPEDGTKVTIVAHGKSKIGIEIAVFTWTGADGSLCAESCTELLFRPIRTEAERKREMVLKSLMVAISGFMTTEDYALAKNIYDAIAAGKIPGVNLDDL